MLKITSIHPLLWQNHIKIISGAFMWYQKSHNAKVSTDLSVNTLDPVYV